MTSSCMPKPSNGLTGVLCACCTLYISRPSTCQQQDRRLRAGSCWPICTTWVAVQALRFKNDKEALLKAIDIGFERSPRPRPEVYKSCIGTLDMAGPLLRIAADLLVCRFHLACYVLRRWQLPSGEHVLCICRAACVCSAAEQHCLAAYKPPCTAVSCVLVACRPTTNSRRTLQRGCLHHPKCTWWRQTLSGE